MDKQIELDKLMNELSDTNTLIKRTTYSEFTPELDAKLKQMIDLYNQIFNLIESIELSPDFQPKNNLEYNKLDSLYEFTILQDGRNNRIENQYPIGWNTTQNLNDTNFDENLSIDDLTPLDIILNRLT